ncbi:unnamed protein product [Callosobruchus maculatus]|uniref:Uncharacterized protein n=1 Tax=Callosobruchus maculatus TaxID=64391 RepID=A0A653D529_CALMS|nr:unnamed protein product [Callosobruchus maculatus]
MMSRKFICHKIFVFMFVISVCRSDNNNMRLKDVLRDPSRYNNNNDNRTDGNGDNFDENDFKGATNKMMDRCSSNSKSDNNNNGNNGDNNNYRGRNYGFDSDRNNEYSDNNYRYNNGNSYNGNSGNSDGQNNNDRYYGREYNSYGGSYGDNNRDNRDRKNCDTSYNGGGNDRSSGGYGYSEYDRDYSNDNKQGMNSYDSRNRDSSSRSNGYDNGYGASTTSYQRSNYNSRSNTGYFVKRDLKSKIRPKRYNKRDYDNQCISQCIFGYMELLDDDQVPSETSVIKWVQDHIADDDLKRIKTLREIRKCFGRLSTNDIQDGCEYSKELSRCLNLELE